MPAGKDMSLVDICWCSKQVTEGLCSESKWQQEIMITYEFLSLCWREMETTTAEPGQGWLCMCLCPGGLKNKEEARRASRPWEQREAAAVKMSQAVSVSLGTGEQSWVGSAGFTSQLPWCYGSRRIGATPSQQGAGSKTSCKSWGRVLP